MCCHLAHSVVVPETVHHQSEPFALRGCLRSPEEQDPVAARPLPSHPSKRRSLWAYLSMLQNSRRGIPIGTPLHEARGGPSVTRKAISVDGESYQSGSTRHSSCTSEFRLGDCHDYRSTEPRHNYNVVLSPKSSLCGGKVLSSRQLRPFDLGAAVGRG